LKNEISRDRIQISAAPDLPLVRLDFGLMEQALCNLLGNAATYSPATKPIHLSAHLEDKKLVLSVSDQGIGLSPGEDKKVFGKFYRGEKARPGGTGLGLSIVQGIVHAHQGTVEVENNPGGGATFTIRLPVETSAHPS
jgi:two-component system sensor histidine kinase KdpD